MTDLVERYLASVERRLPEKIAKDIVAELREALSAKLEAKEDSLGRPANVEEVAEVLKAFGAPAVVAARYEGRSHLIGPNLYPWFWQTQRTAIGVTVAIQIALAALRALASDRPWQTVFRSFDEVISWGLIAFAAVTLVFIVVERSADPAKLIHSSWDPKSLPRDNIRKPKSLFESGISLFFDAVFILFWLKLLPFPNEFPVRDGASVAIVFSPAWAAVYWPILALALAAAAAHAWDLLQPSWSRARSALRIAGHVGGLAVLWVLFRAQPLIDVQPQPETSLEELERATRLVGGMLVVAMGITAAIWAATIGVEIWRQVKAGRPGRLGVGVA